MTASERQIVDQSAKADSNFNAFCNRPDLIRAVVLGIAQKLESLKQRFERKDGRFILYREEGDDDDQLGHATEQKIVEECEYGCWEAMYCNGKMLYMVQGIIYVVNSGMFLVVAGYPHSFGDSDDALITELFYLGS